MNQLNVKIRSSLIALLAVAVFGLLASTGSWSIVHAAPIGSPCVSDGTCDSGLVCPRIGSWICSNLNVRFFAPETRSDRLFSFVNSNSADATYPLTIYTCLSTKAACQTQPVTNTTYWTNQGFAGQPWFQQLDLRPSTSYTLTVQGQEHGAIVNYDQTGFVTWPGFAPRPTNTDPGCNGVTGRCARNISWSTIFPGDTFVAYGPNQPTWTPEVTVQAGANLQAAEIATNGTIYAGGSTGTVERRIPASGWSIADGKSGVSFYSVSTYGSSVWLSGSAASLFRTLDGTNWSSANIPGTTTTQNFPRVIALSATTTLVLSTPVSGGGSQVFYHNGSTWLTLFTDPTLSCTDMAALSANQIWISCRNGIVRYTDNALALPAPTWNTTTITGTPLLQSIATVDGSTIWTGGGTRLYKSIDGGSSFNAISSIPASVTNFTQLKIDSPNSVYFADAGSLYHYTDAGSPAWNVDVSPGAALGGTISTFVLDKANMRIFVLGTDTKAAAYAMPMDSSYHDYNYVTANFDAPGTHTAALTDLDSNTTYYYAVKSTDATGTVAMSEFGGSFTTPLIDPTPPTVTMNALPPMTNVCPLAVSGTAADTAPGTVKAIKLTIDGNAVTPVTGLTNWSASIPCTQLTSGSHTITVRSNDGPNDSTPVTATVVFDNTVPTISIAAASPVTTASVLASGTAADSGTQVVQIQYAVNGSATRTTVPITAGASVPWSATITGLVPGSNTVNVYATDGAGNVGTNAATVIYNVPTFTVTAIPASQTKNIGDIATYTVNVNSQNSFARPVDLTLTGAPGSAVIAFSPLTVSPPANGTISSTLTINTAGAASGTYLMTVTGTDSATALTKTTQITLILNVAPDFTLSATPASQSVVAGDSATYQLHISGSSTYTYPNPPGMTYSHGALPGGVSVTLPSGPLPNNPSLGATANVDIVFVTTIDVPANTGIDITVTDGTKSHTITLFLTATPAPDFSLTSGTATGSVTAGPATQASSSTFFNLTVTALNGFSGAVDLTVPNGSTDPNIFTYFSPASLTPSTSGSTVTLNVHVDSGVACSPPVAPAPPTPCNFPLQLRGQFGTLIKIVTVTLIVLPDTTAPTISNIGSSADYNSVTVSWQTDETADSMLVIYPDASQNDAGAIIASRHDAAFCTTTCHSITLSLPSPSTTYYYSVTSVDQAYGGGNKNQVKTNSGVPLQFTTTAAPDLTQPTIVLDAPADGTTVQGLVTVSAHATDNNPLSQIHLTISPVSGGNIVDTSFPCADVNCAISYQWNTMQAAPLPTFPNGSYRVTVWSVSSSGQVTSTIDYSRSPDEVHTVAIDNDTTAPQILCLPGQTICEPVATNLLCGASGCSIDILWRTDDRSTSEAEYGLSIDCAQYRVLPDGTSVPCTYTDVERYDSTNPSDANPVYTDHRVSLSGLTADRLYHYRITSCNASNLCTN